MNIKIKKHIVWLLVLTHTGFQSSLCSQYLPTSWWQPDWAAWQTRAQQLWQQAPSKQTVYSYLDPRQYSPYQQRLAASIATLGGLGIGGGLWIRSYLQKQTDIRKQAEEQTKQLAHARELHEIAQGLDLEQYAKKQNYVDPISILVEKSQKNLLSDTDSKALGGLDSRIKLVLHGQINDIMKLIKDDFPGKKAFLTTIVITL